MSNEKPVLYSTWRSSCSWRVRIALALKEIPFEILQRCEEYNKVNPMGQVPALVIDGHTLIDSVAIMDYLEETRPEHPFLPQDPYKRALVRAIVQVICSGIQPLQNSSVVLAVGDKKQQIDWLNRWVTRGLEALEKLLAASSGKYCVGDEISMADICLVPQIFNAEKKYHLDTSPYPNLQRVNQELVSLPAFIDSNPFNQPDYDPESSSLTLEKWAA